MGYPEEIPEHSKQYYCDDHELFMVKDVQGNIVCPFCEATLS